MPSMPHILKKSPINRPVSHKRAGHDRAFCVGLFCCIRRSLSPVSSYKRAEHARAVCCTSTNKHQYLSLSARCCSWVLSCSSVCDHVFRCRSLSMYTQVCLSMRCVLYWCLKKTKKILVSSKKKNMHVCASLFEHEMRLILVSCLLHQ